MDRFDWNVFFILVIELLSYDPTFETVGGGAVMASERVPGT
ncbi:hypothetical protein LBBP_01855 [Leptospira borgpetersenii serovar Ballum]|uniref:Uncharacterized protein n=1 Tax=Leptospira borgpetersenii serovar Ballum TaxID=280505 RepID=A0A0S2IR54_LEPBO|nr:hypothetical protein LBBP_01855 [Leptospira borgpetersenii serovar Ballum]